MLHEIAAPSRHLKAGQEDLGIGGIFREHAVMMGNGQPGFHALYELKGVWDAHIAPAAVDAREQRIAAEALAQLIVVLRIAGEIGAETVASR